MRRALPGMLGLLLVAACTFAPDLSRYPRCDAQGACEAGWTCLTLESRCVPDCGEHGVCPAPEPDSGEDSGLPGADAGDAGDVPDGGSGEDGGVDAGTDAGSDGGADAGPVSLGLELDGLAQGIEGKAYGDRLRARGGTPPYIFTATAPLPAGLSLEEDGWLSGTPAVAGDFFLAIDVTDQGDPMKRASGSIPLRIRPVLHFAGPGTLADAPLNYAYSERLSATGGKPPYRFTVAEGSTLPSGLQLNEETGVLTGTSGRTGVVRFHMTVKDDDSPPQEVTRELTLTTVDLGLLPLGVRLMTRSLPDARKGTPYSYTLRSAGGTGANWTVQGVLPPGIEFNASQALLSGTPTQASTTYPLRITVSDLTTASPGDVTLEVK
ncbi:Ig domain-containing protein [Pyxidicoccus xibeiensis]|uniref:Ig domain-containing protein n=1 Tax=Pyxidicoccus xibeiensis TaxID=2906759 RepID=UPI0020A778C5|nr:Ig domain-containing protein [Pyxidicoccus xibeiensis]MCP3142978.1 Ig domain-containing protein [Pyxidicoccus xibeiensis]